MLPGDMSHDLYLALPKLEEWGQAGYTQEKHKAFLAAVDELVLTSRPSWWRRINPFAKSFMAIDARYIREFASIGGLTGVLKYCDTLGVDKATVRSIHQLIYG